MTAIVADRVLNYRDTSSPWAVIGLSKALRHMPPGSTVELIVRDRTALADLRGFCWDSGNVIVSRREDDGDIHLLIRHP